MVKKFCTSNIHDLSFLYKCKVSSTIKGALELSHSLKLCLGQKHCLEDQKSKCILCDIKGNARNAS